MKIDRARNWNALLLVHHRSRQHSETQANGVHPRRCRLYHQAEAALCPLLVELSVFSRKKRQGGSGGDNGLTARRNPMSSDHIWALLDSVAQLVTETTVTFRATQFAVRRGRHYAVTLSTQPCCNHQSPYYPGYGRPDTTENETGTQKKSDAALGQEAGSKRYPDGGTPPRRARNDGHESVRSVPSWQLEKIETYKYVQNTVSDV